MTANQQSAEQPERSEAAIAKQHQSAEASKERSDDTPIAKQHCELCEAARFTHWYVDDATCWIADCEACLVPMVVWKPHGVEPSAAEVAHMLDQLARVGQERFGDDVSIDTDMRTIPDHWHAHARDTHWFRDRAQRRLSRYTGVGGDRIER